MSRVKELSQRFDVWLDEQGKRDAEELAAKRSKTRGFFNESGLSDMIGSLCTLHPEVRDLGELYPRGEKTRLSNEKDIFRIKRDSVLHVLLIGEPEKTYPSFASALDIRRPRLKAQIIGIETRPNGDMVFHEGFVGKNKLSYGTWTSKKGALKAALSMAHDHPKKITAFSSRYLIPR
ncbi:MAG TPA: hypothetical protein VFD45_01010 [Patescibacteria group bacterium]|nr:hypothetical protein [Patescibacteria group bacterium]